LHGGYPFVSWWWWWWLVGKREFRFVGVIAIVNIVNTFGDTSITPDDSQTVNVVKRNIKVPDEPSVAIYGLRVALYFVAVNADQFDSVTIDEVVVARITTANPLTYRFRERRIIVGSVVAESVKNLARRELSPWRIVSPASVNDRERSHLVFSSVVVMLSRAARPAHTKYSVGVARV
jgi:hypothetical protein